MERRSRGRKTSNEPEKEGRHQNEPKSDGEEVQIIEVKKELESADIHEESVKSVVREKSFPSEINSEKEIKSAKNVQNDRIKRTSDKVESVCDNNITESKFGENSQKMAKEQFRDNKIKPCVGNKEKCVRENDKNTSEHLINEEVQKSAIEQFKNIKIHDKALELNASEQTETKQSELNSTCEISNFNLSLKNNFMNQLNLITSTPINGNLNKTYTVKRKVDLRQNLLNSIETYRKIAINQLKSRLLEIVVNAHKHTNNEQTNLTSRDTTPSETGTIQYIDGWSTSHITKEVNYKNTINENNHTMDKDKIATSEDPLKEEENKLLEKSILKANREAIRRLREQRIQLLKDCILSSDSEGENRILDVEKMDQEWTEESNKTTLVLETIYDNLRMRDATDTYKNTSIIKSKDEELYKVTTIIMTEKLSRRADDNIKLTGTIEIKNKKCEINYNYSEDGSTVENLENKSTIDGNVIDQISIPNPHDKKENISLQELAK